MGLFLFAALLMVGFLGLVLIGAVVSSGIRCRQMHHYWKAALTFAALGTIALFAPRPKVASAEYAIFDYVLDGAFSPMTGALVGGGCLATVLAISRIRKSAVCLGSAGG